MAWKTIIRRHTEQEEKEIFFSLKKSSKGYYFYTVPTTIRRSGQVKISNKTYEKLLTKYGIS